MFLEYHGEVIESNCREESSIVQWGSRNIDKEPLDVKRCSTKDENFSSRLIHYHSARNRRLWLSIFLRMLRHQQVVDGFTSHPPHGQKKCETNEKSSEIWDLNRVVIWCFFVACSMITLPRNGEQGSKIIFRQINKGEGGGGGRWARKTFLRWESKWSTRKKKLFIIF